MKYLFSILLLFVFTNSIRARSYTNKNAFTVGFMMGPVAVHTVHSLKSISYNNYGPTGEPSFCVAFTAEQYFNRSHPRLYFSVGGRMSTTYFSAQSYPLFSSYYPQYSNMLIGGLGVSAGLNWDIVRGKKATLTTQMAAVPMVEAGNFAGDVQPNLAGELYLGGTFMKKISLGVRGSHRLQSYTNDNNTPSDIYHRITHIAIDVRFRINAPGKNK